LGVCSNKAILRLSAFERRVRQAHLRLRHLIVNGYSFADTGVIAASTAVEMILLTEFVNFAEDLVQVLL
jgi:hypothetical protein